LREYAEDIAALLARLGIDQAALVGLSMGGLVAMELATAHPSAAGRLGW
jgi:3-oxoadipate enol-lactonase